MPDQATASRVRYRFSPLERRGVIAGWRGGQIASVATGMVVAVFAIRSRPSIGGIVLAVLFVAAAVGVAFWPVQGRTGEQWFPLAVRWLWASATGRELLLAPGPGSGHLTAVVPDPLAPEASPLRPSPTGRSRSGGSGGRRSGGHGVGGPGARAGLGGGRRGVRTGRSVGTASGPFDRLEVVGAAGASGDPSAEMGVVHDGRARTATAVLAVRGHSFALLGPADQDAQIAAWARFLASLAREGSDVHRVQWTESCLPDDGAAVRRHWADHAVLGPDSDAGLSYRALVDELAPVTRRHQVLVALSVSASRSSRSIRAAGGGTGGLVTVLGREVLSVERALDAADIEVEGVLGPRALRRVIGEAFAPAGGAVQRSHQGHGAGPGHPEPLEAGDRADGPAGSWPWPMAVESHWDAVHTDGTWHATYWIAEWPRVDVTPDFLGPLLFSPLRRTITLTMEPVSPSKAARQVAQARTADIADGELRRRGGFLTTARHTREKAGVEERDVELADGHAQYRFTGYVTVTADSRPELVDACSAVEQAAGQARVELRQLYGEQDVAFTCALPLGRGLA
jgi:hypothetical protein